MGPDAATGPGGRVLSWTALVPMAALAFVAVGHLVFAPAPPAWALVLAVPLLFAAVFAAVHHAEVVAHRLGQPFGSIVLALAVTLIEVSLIVSLLLAETEGDSTVARDTVFSAIMIVLNGVIGLCLLIGGIRFHRQTLQSPSATAALGVLGTLAVLALVLPNHTLAAPGPLYAPPQLIFVACVSLALYGFFLHAQIVRHRDDFADPADAATEAAPVARRDFWVSLGLMPLALAAVVLLAELLAVPVETGIDRAGLPPTLVGVVIALIVLLPEGLASLRAAAQNRLQTSVNLALGSALASLCLTIPTVALLSLALGRDLVLGLDAEHVVLLVLSLAIAVLSLTPGRTTALQGGIHLVIFGAFLTISAIP
jgi:Ca2+:H+ antiporter